MRQSDRVESGGKHNDVSWKPRERRIKVKVTWRKRERDNLEAWAHSLSTQLEKTSKERNEARLELPSAKLALSKMDRAACKEQRTV